MKSPSAGSRLFVQIVFPLVIISVAVGVVATVIAAYFFDDLSSRWASQVAEHTTSRVISYFDAHAQTVERGARVLSGDSEILEAVETNDASALRKRIAAMNGRMRYDVLIVLDSDDSVMAISGETGLKVGTRLFWGQEGVGTSTQSTIFTRLGSYETLLSLQPLSGRDDGYAVAAGTIIDDQFMQRAVIEGEDVFGFYDRSGRAAALGFGAGVDSAEKTPLVPLMVNSGPTLDTLLLQAEGSGSAFATVREEGREYTLHARKITLDGGAETRTAGYIVGAIDQSVPAQAGKTAREFVGLWSILAILALIGIGGLTARRVSRPLAELAAGARSVADGDFSTKAHSSSVGEIADLANSFNDMTDSLRDRSESLTKKVLELATLYEMSRALGSTLDMEELLESVLDSALRIFDLDLGYIVLRDSDSGSLSVRATKGVSGVTSDGALRSSMSEWVVREGRPLVFNPDSGSSDEQAGHVSGAMAALCVPLVSGGETIGSITVGSSDPLYRFTSDDVRLLSTIANHVTIAVGNIELFSSLQEAYLATVRSLAAAVDAKDSYTRGHSDHVASYAMRIAERLELAHEQRIALEMAAYLHDIGKIGVPESILLKPGDLDPAEMTQMRHHPLIGANILKPVAFPWEIAPVVRHHHECWDGSGYPAGLEGEEIPLLARILSVADSYEAMTADRPYRAGRTADEAMDELRACAGVQFDPVIVETFIDALLLEEVADEDDALEIGEHVTPEETRAILAVVFDGVLSSFGRLGGTRIAQNVENELTEYLCAENLPFAISQGRLSFTDGFPSDPARELEQIRSVLGEMDRVIGRLSGQTLVEHFHVDAMGGLSGRMRSLARDFGLSTNP